MNKEEIQQEIKNIIGMELSYTQEGALMYLIDECFDNIGSRTCKNCEHSEYHPSADVLECYCEHETMKQMCWEINKELPLFEVTKDFGCNQFKRKQKKIKEM